jgi:hypothetical protein
VGLSGLGIAGGQWGAPLGQEVPHGMSDGGRMTLGTHSGCEACGAANLAGKAAEQAGATV